MISYHSILGQKSKTKPNGWKTQFDFVKRKTVPDIYIYIYISKYINFVCHIQMSKYMYKKQDIYLLKSYTSVSSKPSKNQ